MESSISQSAQQKHYSNNKINILTYYKSYYQENKEKLKQKRRDRYSTQKSLRQSQIIIQAVN
jgi:hypothetical protein